MRDISFGRLSRVGMICLMLLVFLAASACGTGSAPETDAVSDTRAATEHATTPQTAVEKEAASVAEIQEKALENCSKANGALMADAQSYAEDYGISEERAIRRTRLQSCFGNELATLERRLRRNEPDSFAGLWIQHEPEYRFVVLFTENGQQTIRPYTQDEPYTMLLKVRSDTEATFAELRAAQNKADRIANRLGSGNGSGLNVMKNHAELYVTDRDKFEAELREAGMRLPEHVVLVEAEPLAPS